MSKRLRELGIEIPPDEDTPLVRKLVAVIEQLFDEIDRLKGLPELPKRASVAPSPLNDDSAPPSKQQADQKKARKKRKRPKNHKRSKLARLKVGKTITLQPDNVPAGAAACVTRLDPGATSELPRTGSTICELEFLA